MKKILGLSIAVLLITGLVVGGTLAYFSDTEDSTGNTFTAGTLNLTLDGNDGTAVTDKFAVEDTFPGDSGYATWTLVNNGSIDGYLNLSVSNLVNAENYDALTDEAESADDADTSDDTGGGELGANLDVQLFVDVGGDGVYVDGTDTLIYDGDLDSIGTAGADQDALLAAGETLYVTLAWSIDTAVNNIIQGDSVSADIEFILNQIEDQP